MKEKFDKTIRDNISRGHGNKWFTSKKREANKDIEDRSKKPAGIEPYGPNCWNFSWASINRFLRKRIGRKWDDVWSEICEKNDARAEPKPAIFLAMENHLVDLNPMFDEDGMMRHNDGRKFYGGFYVDRSGLLQEANFKTPWKEMAARKKQSPPPYVVVDELHQYHKIKGIWYLVEFSYVPEKSSGEEELKQDILQSYYEQMGGRTFGKARFDKFYGSQIYAVSKRQANSKEVERIEAEVERRTREYQKKFG